MPYRFRSWFSVLLALLLLPQLGLALRPQTEFVRGEGFKTWMAPIDAKAWRMERLLYELRQKDDVLRIKALKELGFERHRVGRELVWPEWQEPITVTQEHVGFNRRFASILTVPYAGRVAYAMVVFFQEGNDQNYWKPWQLFEFDTDPVPGLGLEAPDIMGDQIQYLQVRHLIKDDIYGNREVISLFKFDDRGEEARLRLTWQENDEYFRSGKYQGDPFWENQVLKLGNQRIQRALTMKRYHYTSQGEDVRYQGIKPIKTTKVKERFSWNPADFSFYDSMTELEKLVRDKSPAIRRMAARRLGAILATTHPQLEAAALKDKDAYVRMQAVLALGEIGDPKALKSLYKAQLNNDEDDTVLDAVDTVVEKLEGMKRSSEAGPLEVGGVSSSGLANAGPSGEQAASPSATGTTFTASELDKSTVKVKAGVKKTKRRPKKARAPAPLEPIAEPKANLEQK